MIGTESEWLWILGDNESIKPEAVPLIADAIEAAGKGPTDILLFNLWHPSQGKVSCGEINTFLQEIDLGDAIFISATLWRTSTIESRIATYIDYAYTWSSQLLVCLTALSEPASSAPIVDTPLINLVYFQSWSHIDYAQRVLVLYRHPVLRGHQKAFTFFQWPQLRWALETSAHQQVRSGKATLHRWLRLAVEVCLIQLLHTDRLTGLRRTSEVASIVKRLHPIRRLVGLGVSGIRRRRRGHAGSGMAPVPIRVSGL